MSGSEAGLKLASQFEIEATARPGHTGDELLKVIDEELDKVRTQGVGDDEVARATTSFFAGTVFSLESDGARAERFEEYDQMAGDPGFLPKDFKNHAVTAQAVAAAARTWLPKAGRVVAVVTPTPGAPLAGTVVSVNGRPQ